LSVPRRKVRLGPTGSPSGVSPVVRYCVSGPCPTSREISGAASARITRQQMTTTEPMATRSRRSRAQASCHGPRPLISVGAGCRSTVVTRPLRKTGHARVGVARWQATSRLDRTACPHTGRQDTRQEGRGRAVCLPAWLQGARHPALTGKDRAGMPGGPGAARVPLVRQLVGLSQTWVMS